ncbi:hypothetical protein D3C80_1307440 [compost metagenome]
MLGRTEIVVALECGTGQVQVAEYIAQPRTQALPALERPAQQHHRQVGQQGKGGGLAVEGPEVALAQRVPRYFLEKPQPQVEHQSAGRIAGGEQDVFHQQVIEFLECLIVVLTPGQRHFLEHERMAANGALAEDHQVARKDVGAFDRDEDRRPLPVAPQVVVRAHDDALATVHVHGVLDAFAASFGQVVLEDRRQHRGFLAQVHGLGGQQAGTVHQPGVAANACQRFLDTFEGSQWHVELLADIGVLAGHQAGVLGSPCTHGRQ